MSARRAICLVVLLTACSSRTTSSSETGAATDTSTSDASASTSSTTDDPDPETSTEDSGEDDTGSTFVADDDLPPDLSCSVFDQDCPEGYKCVPSVGAQFSPSRCVPVLGDKGVGEPCEWDGHETGTDDCDETSHCWAINDDEPPYTDVCRPLCTGTRANPTCPGEGEDCQSYSCHILGQVGIPLCELGCDPLEQACDEGLACTYYYEEFGCMVVDEPQPIGEVCEYEWNCAPGLRCVEAEFLPVCAGERCCTSFCEFGDDPSCAGQLPGTVCTELPVSDPIQGCPVFGMCALPEG